MIPKIARVLRGCVNAETAFVQPDYPYGARLRCKRRNWLEFKAKQGFRYVSQTSDPKVPAGVERWNKPKAGTYTFLSVLVLTDEHTTPSPEREPTSVSSFGIGPNDSEDALHAFMAAFGDDMDDNQKKQADFLRLLIPRYGTKKTGKLFRVRDAVTGEMLTPDLATASHPIFAAAITTNTGDVSLLRRDGMNVNTVEISADVLESLRKYNPPVQYIDEHRKFGLVDSYRLGKRLLIEYVPEVAKTAKPPEATSKPPEVPPSRRRTDEAWPLNVNAHVTPDSASEFCPEIDPDQAASPFSDE